jgi:hypothetical protein
VQYWNIKLLLRCNIYDYYSENAIYRKYKEDIPTGFLRVLRIPPVKLTAQP